jgi:hypothetical protein
MRVKFDKKQGLEQIPRDFASHPFAQEHTGDQFCSCDPFDLGSLVTV